MEEKDIIDKKLKHEIEIFKVFAIFVALISYSFIRIIRYRNKL